jgi:hypothetical protein
MALTFLEGFEKPRLKPLPEHFSVTGHPRAPPRFRAFRAAVCSVITARGNIAPALSFCFFPARGKQRLAPSRIEANGAKRGKNGGSCLSLLVGEDSKT